MPRGSGEASKSYQTSLVDRMRTCVQKILKIVFGFKGSGCMWQAPIGAPTCRSKGPKGEWIERTYDYVIECKPQGEISQIKGVEDSESRPHIAVSFVVEKEKEMQLPKCAAWLQWRQAARKKHQRRR